MWLRNHVVNPVVRALARTPGHRLLGGRLVVLSYTGRRTGRRHELPVMAVAAGDDLVVVVGEPAAKTWWRNFDSVPRDVRVRIRGRLLEGAARRLGAGDTGYRESVAAYRRAFPRVDVAAGAPIVLLTGLVRARGE